MSLFDIFAKDVPRFSALSRPESPAFAQGMRPSALSAGHLHRDRSEWRV